MERKNTILLTVIAVATLLVAVVGATFAYFTATVTDERGTDAGQGNTNLQTGQVSNSTVVANVDGSAGKFSATNIYPGHKEVAALSVAATGSVGSKTGVTFNYNVTENGLGSGNVKVRLYKSTTEVTTNTTGNYFSCTQKVETVDGEARYSETCSVAETGLGTQLKEVELTGGAETVILGNDTITVSTKGVAEKVYYYVVVEFVNKAEGQNSSMNTTLAGQVTVAASAA